MIMENNNKNLYYLNELSDYKVDDDYQDVRGWEVIDEDNRCVGKVDNLLVNKNTERVVYLDVEVDKSIIEANHQPYSSAANNDGVHEFLNEDGDNHLIIPIGLVTLAKDSKKVNTNKINHQTFSETKRMKKDHEIDREYEVMVLESYNRNDEKYPEGDKLYEREEFVSSNKKDH